jgi:protein SCO1/2
VAVHASAFSVMVVVAVVVSAIAGVSATASAVQPRDAGSGDTPPIVPAGIPAGIRPAPLDGVAFAQRLGATLPLDAEFTDENGSVIRLGDYFGRTPVLLVPAYYRCPMLCGVVLQGVVSALRALPFDVGREFTVVTFSFAPGETPADGIEKRRQALAGYRRPDAAAGWHFLTGGAEAIARLTEAIGFRAVYDPASGEFAHASGVVVATAEGRVSHYFYGVEYAPRDLRLALVEAAANRIGTPVDRLLLYCFEYDPTTGRYSRVALGALRTGGIATVLALGAFVTVMVRRERSGRGTGRG